MWKIKKSTKKLLFPLIIISVVVTSGCDTIHESKQQANQKKESTALDIKKTGIINPVNNERKTEENKQNTYNREEFFSPRKFPYYSARIEDILNSKEICETLFLEDREGQGCYDKAFREKIVSTLNKLRFNEPIDVDEWNNFNPFNFECGSRNSAYQRLNRNGIMYFLSGNQWICGDSGGIGDHYHIVGIFFKGDTVIVTFLDLGDFLNYNTPFNETEIKTIEEKIKKYDIQLEKLRDKFYQILNSNIKKKITQGFLNDLEQAIIIRVVEYFESVALYAERLNCVKPVESESVSIDGLKFKYPYVLFENRQHLAASSNYFDGNIDYVYSNPDSQCKIPELWIKKRLYDYKYAREYAVEWGFSSLFKDRFFKHKSCKVFDHYDDYGGVEKNELLHIPVLLKNNSLCKVISLNDGSLAMYGVGLEPIFEGFPRLTNAIYIFNEDGVLYISNPYHRGIMPEIEKIFEENPADFHTPAAAELWQKLEAVYKREFELSSDYTNQLFDDVEKFVKGIELNDRYTSHSINKLLHFHLVIAKII